MVAVRNTGLVVAVVEAVGIAGLGTLVDTVGVVGCIGCIGRIVVECQVAGTAGLGSLVGIAGVAAAECCLIESLLVGNPQEMRSSLSREQVPGQVFEQELMDPPLKSDLFWAVVRLLVAAEAEGLRCKALDHVIVCR